jgi:lipopolysaccharide biosynthesis glycosyltransferase
MIRRIFMYWDSGFDNCPLIIKQCIKSWKYYNKNYEIIELNDSNLSSWIDIEELVKNKNITKTSLSDVIRIFLLKNHGGFWVDSTVFCIKSLDEWIDECIANGFFAFSFENSCDRMISSWFLYGEKDNYIINEWYKNVVDYIKKAEIIGVKNNPGIVTINEWNNKDKYNNHYFWFHYLFGDLHNNDNVFRDQWSNIKKMSANPPHYLQHIGLNTQVNDDFLSKYKDMAPMFKLTYRYDFTICKSNCILNYINYELLKYKITFIFDNTYTDILIKVINNILEIDEKYYRNYYVFYLTFWGSVGEENELKNKLLNNFKNINFVIKNIMISYPRIYDLCSNLYNINNAQNHLKTPLLYCRGFLPEIWEDVHDTLLYMDLDIIILKPLSMLFNEILNQQDNKLIACNNQKLKPNFGEIKNISKVINDNKEDFIKYKDNLINKILSINIDFEIDNNEGFNAGIFIINMDECRKFNFTSLFEICMHINKFENIFKLNDQSIMNFILFKDYYKLNNNWNYMGTCGSDTCNYKKIYKDNICC